MDGQITHLHGPIHPHTGSRVGAQYRPSFSKWGINMATRDVSSWETSICHVVSNEAEEEIVIRGHKMSDLIGNVSFADVMFLMLQGELPDQPQRRVLDALLVASVEHGIAPPSMVARCYASYGTSIQAAIGAGVGAFGDRMGGLGEQMAQLMVERLEQLGGDTDIDDAALKGAARDLVAEVQARGERVPGFGIPLHGADPRAPAVLKVAKREGTYGVYGRFGEAIERALAEARGGRPIPMNLDGVSAVVILDLGFHWRSTRMFLITPRSVSMGAHFLEEQAQDTTWRHVRGSQITYEGP
ncbi:MAG: citryl-CoA lyase [Chromatiales bacterium]|jgi:citrate synthase|nr:citryl-CoA lyase [Chromatiales bacterium]